MGDWVLEDIMQEILSIVLLAVGCRTHRVTGAKEENNGVLIERNQRAE